MNLARNLLGILALQSASLRRTAAAPSLTAAWVLMAGGFLSYALIRRLVYGTAGSAEDTPLPWVAAFWDLHLIQALLFLSLVYLPVLVCLGNALADDGLGYTLSCGEYRTLMGVLFPLWGMVLFLAGSIQWALPGFLELGILEVSAGIAALAVLLPLVTGWAVREIHHLTVIAALGALALSAFTLPIFFILLYYPWVSWLCLIPALGFLGYRQIQAIRIRRSRRAELIRQAARLAAQPDDADTNFRLGLLHALQHHYETAQRYLESARKADPGNPDYGYHLGRIHEIRGDWAEASKNYETTYHLDPDYGDSAIRRELAKGRLHSGRLQDAVELLQAYLAEAATDAEARYWLATALHEQSRFAESRTQIDMLRARARTDPAARKLSREWILRARNLARRSAA